MLAVSIHPLLRKSESLIFGLEVIYYSELKRVTEL